MARKEKTGSWILSYVTGMDVLDEYRPPSDIHHVGVFDSAETAIMALEEYIKSERSGYCIPIPGTGFDYGKIRQFITQHGYWNDDWDSNIRFYIEQAEI